MLFQYNAYAILTIKDTAALKLHRSITGILIFYHTNRGGQNGACDKTLSGNNSSTHDDSLSCGGMCKKGKCGFGLLQQRYSYDEKEVFSCDSWTRYDKEYLEKLKADYELES